MAASSRTRGEMVISQRMRRGRSVAAGLRRRAASAVSLRTALYRSIGPPRATSSTRQPRHASFDVFDTLLTRSLTPELSTWVEVGRRASSEGLLGLDPAGFASVRKRAGQVVRDRGRPPIFEDIYDVIASQLQLYPVQRHRLACLELETEADLLHVVPRARGLLRLARDNVIDGKIIFISDMHLPSSFIRSQLQRHACWQEGDSLWVSAEAGARKRDGSLFAMIERHESWLPQQMVHFGDNPIADGMAARWAGLRSRAVTDAVPNRYERLLSDRVPSVDGSRSWLAGVARVTRVELDEVEHGGRPNDAETVALQRIGVDVMGPMLVSFCLWLLHRAQVDGLDRLVFISRDGEILLKITEKLAATLGLDIECQYLHGGRAAWQRPAFAVDDTELEPFIHRIIDKYTVVTASGTAARLGLATAELQRAAAGGTEPAVDPDAPLTAIQRERLKAWLLSDEGRRRVLDAAHADLATALAYLRQERLHQSGWAIVDVGWRGTTVRALNRLLGPAGGDAAQVLFIGYVGEGGVRRLPNCQAFIWDADDHSRRSVPSGALALTEAFCSGSHGSVTGYATRSDGTIVPVLHTEQGIAATDWRLAELRHALLGFVDNVSPHLRRAHLATTDPHAVLGVLTEFVERPAPAEAAVFGDCPREEDAQGSSTFRLARPFRMADLPAVMRPGPSIGRNLGWRAGALARTAKPTQWLFRLIFALTDLQRRWR